MQETLNLLRYFICRDNGIFFFSFLQDGFQLYYFLQAKFNIFQFGTKSVAMHHIHTWTHTHILQKKKQRSNTVTMNLLLNDHSLVYFLKLCC